MARRRPRPRTPRKTPGKTPRGVFSWIAVLVVSGGIGWIWWRAAYRPGEGVAGVGWQTFTEWRGWIDRWRGHNGDENAYEEMPSVAGDDGDLDVESPRVEGVGSAVRAPETVVLAGPDGPTPRIQATARLATGEVTRAESPAVAEWMRVEGDGREDQGSPKEGTNVLGVQLALARRGISSGPIDGVAGSQTRAALRLFQRQEGLPTTGLIDDRTLARLNLDPPVLTNYLVTGEDVGRLTWVPSTWLGKASRERLDYQSVLELVAEKSHTHPKLLRQLNPMVNWNQVKPGTTIRVPAAELPPLRGRAGFVRISLREKALRVYDPSSNLVAHFPCSIARKVEKRPVGELRVARLAGNPNYRFDPDIFPESPEARRIGKKLMIPPGPNNPVGTAWIGLSRPGYGIHGTPNPEEVGRTESHGCFRLANWNAEFLMKAAWVGMPVIVEP